MADSDDPFDTSIVDDDDDPPSKTPDGKLTLAAQTMFEEDICPKRSSLNPFR